MATYVIGDIHGEYSKLRQLLYEEIKLKDEDTVYVLGDVLDRGEAPVKAMMELMQLPGVIPIAGNHEAMALKCLKFLLSEVTENSVAQLDAVTMGALETWLSNGSQVTIEEFAFLDADSRQDVIEYLEEFEVSAEVEAGGNVFWLVHGGLGNFDPKKELDDYSLDELIWERPDYSKPYFADKYVVTGHTPTQCIAGNPRPGYIYRANNHIAIDCGAYHQGGRLAAVCLETGEEYYAE